MTRLAVPPTLLCARSPSMRMISETGAPNAFEKPASSRAFLRSSIFICIMFFLENSTVSMPESYDTNCIDESVARIDGVSAPIASSAFRYSCGGCA